MHKVFPIALGASLALAACAAPDNRVAVTALAPEALGLTGAPAPLAPGDWWRALGDPQLDRIMSDALSSSPRLEAALARVREAQALLSARQGEAGPQVTLDANEQRTRLSERYIIPPPYGGSTQWQGQAQVNLGWNLDFFGRQADAITAARDSTRATQLDHEAARLALTGAVAQTYVELVRAEHLVTLGDATVAQRERSLGLVDARIRAKLASQLDARAAQTLLAQARQSVLQAQARRTLLVHALAELAGHGADYYAGIGPTRVALDSALPIPKTLPADLLSRRPDIAGAQARIEAAAAGRSVARKAFYPNINLTALVGVQALGLGNLFSTAAATYGPGAAIHLPIFDGGKLKADHAAATAQLDGAIAAYNVAVTGAVREAADALARIAAARDELTQQRAATQGLADVTRLNRVRVESGLQSRLDLIGPDLQLLQSQQAQVNLEADAALAAVQLVVATGGGFAPDIMPAEGNSQ
ncbi:efflux transporter outer membrane subunit [Sphingobium aromaticiconvertens]|uniref:efflux transporter outer membrane subunit n=1 Tax=Sphingobium aromaticiconvertens TaxID=365341 RepID=UPI0030174C3E